MNDGSCTKALGAPQVAVFLFLIISASGSLAQSNGTTTSYFWKQCDEDVLLVHVDPEPIRPLVPAGHSFALDDGQAFILLVVQDCPTYWFDGKEIGATQEVHHWVSLDKPRDVRIVPGAEQTLPTMSWYPVFMGSTNAAIRDYWIRSGTDAQAIEGLTFSPFTDQRSGEVRVGPEKGYRWTVQTKAPWARMVGVNHDLYGQAPSGKPVFHRIQCLLTVDGWDGTGTLNVMGGSDIHDLLSAGSYAVEGHTFQPLWCHGTLAERQE